MKYKTVLIGIVSIVFGWNCQTYSTSEKVTPKNPPTQTGQADNDANQGNSKKKKSSRQTKKQGRKKMYNDLKFKIGDGVTVTTGPMKDMYGVIIYYDKDMKYLIRFTGTQQMFFAEVDIKYWGK